MSRNRESVIFLIEEDDDTRPILKQNLNREGYCVIVAFDEEDALQRVEGGHVHADLILFNAVGVSTDEALAAARRIHRRAGFDSRTPIVVMAEKYGAEMEGKDIMVGENEYVTYLEDGYQLQDLLARLILSRSS